MQRKVFLWIPIVALVTAFPMACGGDKPTSPTTPTGAAAGIDSGAAGDGVTLKVNAPVLSSPIGGARLTEAEAVVTFKAATAKYVANESFTYRVELLDDSGRTLETKTGTATSYKFSTSLDSNTQYRWRVRAEQQNLVGPWSSTETFKSMERPSAYIRGNEVYDPLIDGRTIGKISGPVTWIPGVGIRLDAEESSIEYRLEQTCSVGEFSMIVTGVGAGTGNDKSKIMAMRQENGTSPAAREFLVDNDRRMTVEKREDGNIAWRFITHDDQVDTIGAERRPAGVRDENTYLWTSTWNGAFTVKIEQLPGRNVMYEFGKGYGGRPYDANPHVAYVGAGTTFGGHGTVAGMIVRQVWLSPRPRPSWATQ